MSARILIVVASACLVAGCASSAPRAAAGGASVDTRLLELERESTRARLEIERLQHRVAELEAERAARPAPVAAPAPAPRPAPGFEASDETASRSYAPIEESELGDEPAEGAPGLPETERYEAALKLLRDGRTAEAESALSRFAADAPDSDLADNAWFWIGESRLARGDLAGALSAYRITIDRYPEGNKVPDAMLKLGTTLALDGNLESAREAWRELIRRFPDTVAAETARERLGGE